MQLKKIVYLKSLVGNTNTAILTLYKEASGLGLTLDLYNIAPNHLALGLNINNKIYKFPINANKNQFRLNQENSIDNDISCAVVDVSDISKPKAILSGTYAVNQQVVDSFASDKALTKTNDDRAQLYEYDEETVENQINSIISPKDCNKDCSSCRYRQAFFDSKSNVLTNNQTSYNANQDTPKIPEQNFYDDIAEQLEEMFDKYPTETNLTAMIPNSRWIKIDYYNKDGYYCIGIIKDNNNVRYIGYAMPSRVNLPPPDDITEYAQFLPIGDGENGYYVVYQDAQNGESIKISFC